MSFLVKLWPRAQVEVLSRELFDVRSENKALSTALRNALDAAVVARDKAADSMAAQIQAQDKLIMAMQQMTNYNAFVMGSKIPVFPGVGPERPKVEDIPQEQMPEIKRARNMRNTMTPQTLNALLNNEWDLNKEQAGEQSQ